MGGAAVSSRQRGRWIGVAVCWVSLAAAGCEMPVPQGGGGTGPGKRAQRLSLTPKQELEIGRDAYRKVLSELSDRLLPDDDRRVVRARGITSRLIKAAGVEPLQREINLQHIDDYYFEWELHVVQERKVNAFCLPAGKMILYTGIMTVARDDDELATVISHEMSHALAHHASEKIARSQSGGILESMRSKSYDREQEAEADHIGVFLMAFAGYDPDESVHFWRSMSSLHKDGAPPEILSDHPSDEHRVKNLQQWAPQARAAKRAYDEGRIARRGAR